MQAFVICPGPSLTQSDCDAVRRWYDKAPGNRCVIAVNLAWHMVPWAPVLFAGDSQWWAHDDYRLDVGERFLGECWTAGQGAARKYGINLLTPPLMTNSGMNAIQLARREFRMRQIRLLGMDYQPGTDGSLHCHADHPAPLHNAARFEIRDALFIHSGCRAMGVVIENWGRNAWESKLPFSKVGWGTEIEDDWGLANEGEPGALHLREIPGLGA